MQAFADNMGNAPHQSIRTRDRTLVDVLLERASRQPDQVAFTFLGEGGPDTDGNQVLKYRDLFEQAAGFASLLQERGMTGERVLLVFKSNAWFVISFFACLLAGAIAVPTAPPRREQMAQRLGTIAANAGARAGIPDSDEVMRVAIGLGHDDVHWFDVCQLSQGEGLRARAANWRPPLLRGDSLALLQYTSGSTGDPKGVMVSHDNLMVNTRHITEAFGYGPDTRGLFALPLYHDMGLIGGILQPLYAGFPVHVMTPAQFVQKPQRWLQLISQLHISASGGPNFMYDLAAQTVQGSDIEDVDLSCWRVASCGAEPIRASTMQSFAQKFAPYGFNSDAFYPCYGMAEATLFVTGKSADSGMQLDAAVPGNPPVVGCGRPRPDTRIEIVDPKSRCALPEGREGEIWVGGPTVARGYWKNAEATSRTFDARLRDTGDGPFLRTGDLGYRKNGELFVTGRLKDLIILRGRNIAPQDLEVEAEASHPGLQPGSGAAFMLSELDRERLILAFELKREWRRRTDAKAVIEAAVRASIARSYQLRVDDVVLLQPGALPRTSSGKVRRSQCRAEYEQGKFVLMEPGAARLAGNACSKV